MIYVLLYLPPPKDVTGYHSILPMLPGISYRDTLGSHNLHLLYRFTIGFCTGLVVLVRFCRRNINLEDCFR